MWQLLFTLFFLNTNAILCYRTDIDEGGEKAFCKYRNHLTFKPTATCCAGEVVKPALEIDTFWKDCVSNIGPQKSDTLEGIGVYIIISHLYSELIRIGINIFLFQMKVGYIPLYSWKS